MDSCGEHFKTTFNINATANDQCNLNSKISQ